MSSSLKALGAARLMLIAYAVVSLLAGSLMLVGSINSTLFVAVNHFSAAYLSDDLLKTLTMFGEGLWQMALVAPLLLLAPRVNAATLYAAPFALAASQLPKLVLQLPRPSLGSLEQQAHLVDAPSLTSTFPSGHAVIAALVATVLILDCDLVRRRAWLAVGALTVSALIAWTRVAVGAHWPMDVLVGSALGVVVGWVGSRLAALYYRDSSPARFTVGAIYLLCVIALALAKTHDWSIALTRDILVAVGGASAVLALARVRLADSPLAT